jgi:hypothetical protein
MLGSELNMKPIRPPNDAPHYKQVDQYTHDYAFIIFRRWVLCKGSLVPIMYNLQVVRDSGDAVPSVHINVDCLTFDRVLLFLEAHLLGKPPPQWSLHLLDDLAKVWERRLRSLDGVLHTFNYDRLNKERMADMSDMQLFLEFDKNEFTVCTLDCCKIADMINSMRWER